MLTTESCLNSIDDNFRLEQESWYFLLFSETGSSYVGQCSLKLVIHLPQPP